MRTNYAKPNSHTYVKAASFVRTVREVVYLAQITEYHRLRVLFDVGCMIAEKYSPQLAERLLTDKKYGYWAWWLVEFLRDDEAILYYRPEAFNQYSYEAIKTCMLYDKDVSDNFVRFIIPIVEPRF